MYDRLNSENGTKTGKARNALISLIRDRKLEPGDKLPNQKELVSMLGLSATTVMRAINSLKDYGYLDVRNKVGVFLRKAEWDSLAGRTIGLASLYLEGNSPFYCYLILAIQSRLLRAGCKTVSFFRRKEVDERDFHLNDCLGLPDALKTKSLDGLIDTGGFCKAYHERTGIAGYTLIYNSHGLRLCAHEPFDSIETAIERRKDIHSEVTVFETRQNRLLVRDTDVGKALLEQLKGLKLLMEEFRNRNRD